MRREHVEQLLADRAARRSAVLLRWLSSGEQRVVHDASELDDAELAGAAREALTSDSACSVASERGDVFVQPFNPPLRMAIIGAVHIAQHLVPMARGSGYAVTVIDPRSAFASPERFPDTELSHEWPDAALAAIGLDARTAVIALSHDPKLDDPALDAALASEAFYIGALGSRTNQGRRLERLRERGFEQAALARIHGPIGLDIGARSPAEIAVSILAEVTATLRMRPA
jgi:xanthine dehydrogenase accessory factor